MITLIVAIAVGGGSFAAAYWAADWGVGWSVFAGVVGFGVFQGVFGFLLQKRVKRDMEKVQQILVGGQKKLQQKMQRWQMRPPGSIQAAQNEIFADTKVFVKEALAQTETLRKYRLWVPMMDRQIATAQLQLSWMIKDFKTVDKLMPKAICLDPTMSAIKMARLYMLEKPMAEIEKEGRRRRRVQDAHGGLEEKRQRDAEAQSRVPHEQPGRPLLQFGHRRPVVFAASRGAARSHPAATERL